MGAFRWHAININRLAPTGVINRDDLMPIAVIDRGGRNRRSSNGSLIKHGLVRLPAAAKGVNANYVSIIVPPFMFAEHHRFGRLVANAHFHPSDDREISRSQIQYIAHVDITVFGIDAQIF